MYYYPPESPSVDKILAWSLGDSRHVVGCHSGTIAADEDAMKEKFKTVDEFVKAAMATTNPMMKEIQQNKEAIETAAKELGLKEAPATKQ